MYSSRFKTIGRLLSGIAVVSLCLLGGCSSPPPPQSPTTQGVRADSDKFFEKVKQEEKVKPQERPAEGSGY